MNRRIVNCISTIKELDVEELNRSGCGVELQDFVEPNLSKEDVEMLIDGYKNRLAQVKGIKSLHGPFLDLKPASPDKEIRRVSQISTGGPLRLHMSWTFSLWCFTARLIHT